MGPMMNVALHVQSLKDTLDTKNMLKKAAKFPGTYGGCEGVTVRLGVGGGVKLFVSVSVRSDEADNVHCDVYVRCDQVAVGDGDCATVMLLLSAWYAPVRPTSALEPSDGVNDEVSVQVSWAPAPNRCALNPLLAMLSDFVMLSLNSSVRESGLNVTVPLAGSLDRDDDNVMRSVSVMVAVCSAVEDSPVTSRLLVWIADVLEVGEDEAVGVRDRSSVPVSVTVSFAVSVPTVALPGSDDDVDIVSVDV